MSKKTKKKTLPKSYVTEEVIEDRSPKYVLVNKPYDGGPFVFGPYTFAQADSLLKAGAANRGTYQASCGYWSDLPCWWLDDTDVWLMRKLEVGNVQSLLTAIGR